MNKIIKNFDLIEIVDVVDFNKIVDIIDLIEIINLIKIANFNKIVNLIKIVDIINYNYITAIYFLIFDAKVIKQFIFEIKFVKILLININN